MLSWMNLALTMHTQPAWQPSFLANQTVFLESLSTAKQTARHFCSHSWLDLLMVNAWLTLGLSEFQLWSVPSDACTGRLVEEPEKEVDQRERQGVERTSCITQILLFIYTVGAVLRGESVWEFTYTTMWKLPVELCGTMMLGVFLSRIAKWRQGERHHSWGNETTVITLWSIWNKNKRPVLY